MLNLPLLTTVALIFDEFFSLIQSFIKITKTSCDQNQTLVEKKKKDMKSYGVLGINLFFFF
jgi:hypothetical protein